MDVKKIGRIPDGGGWRALGRAAVATTRLRSNGPGYDYIHSLVDDHSRLAYSEIHDDEKADTCAAFFARAVDYFAAHGIDRIERVMTDNAGLPPRQPAAVIADVGARTIHQPHCPWQNGKVERLNRTLTSGPTGRCSPATRTLRSPATWLDTKPRRRHSASEASADSRLSPT